MASVFRIAHPGLGGRASAQGPLPEPCRRLSGRLQRAQQARTGASGTGTAGTRTQKTSVPYERTRAPEPAPSRQRTFAELCSTKDFVEWVTAVADFQALVEPEVHGVLQAAEFGAVWRSRVETPMIMCDLPKVPLRDKKVSWETLLTGKVVKSKGGVVRSHLGCFRK